MIASHVVASVRLQQQLDAQGDVGGEGKGADEELAGKVRGIGDRAQVVDRASKEQAYLPLDSALLQISAASFFKKLKLYK